MVSMCMLEFFKVACIKFICICLGVFIFSGDHEACHCRCKIIKYETVMADEFLLYSIRKE
jgi:hypothetical protein